MNAMNASELEVLEGKLIGDAIDRYLKKKQQIDNYGITDKAVRQKDSAARGLARALAGFSPGNVGPWDEGVI
jgi:hypothetical protein